MSDNKFYYTGESRGDWDSESVCDSVDAAVDVALDGVDASDQLPETIEVYVLDTVTVAPRQEDIDTLAEYTEENLLDIHLSDALSEENRKVLQCKSMEFLSGVYGALGISKFEETTETVTVNVQDWLASHPEERAALEAVRAAE